MGARTFPARRNSNGPLGSDDACGNDKTLPMYPWAVACVTQSESQSHQRMRIRADAWRHSAVKAEANDGERPDLMNRGLRVSTRARQARTAPSLSLLEIPGTALRAREGGVEWRRTDARRPRSPVADSQSRSRPVVACSRTTAGRGPFVQGQQHRRRRSASVYSPSLARLVSKDGSPSCVNVPAVGGCCCVIDVLVCVDLQIRCRSCRTAWSKIGRAHSCITQTTSDKISITSVRRG